MDQPQSWPEIDVATIETQEAFNQRVVEMLRFLYMLRSEPRPEQEKTIDAAFMTRLYAVDEYANRAKRAAWAKDLIEKGEVFVG